MIVMRIVKPFLYILCLYILHKYDLFNKFCFLLLSSGNWRVSSGKENRIQTSDGINPYTPVMEIEESNVHFILNSS